MPFQTLGDQPLDCVVHVRVKAEEKIRLQEDADLAGMSVSALIRARYFGRRISAKADRGMVAELRRMGGLMKHSHNESNGEYSHLTAGILREIQQYISSLNSTMQGHDK